MEKLRTYPQEQQGKDTVVAVVFAGEEEGQVMLWLFDLNQLVEIEKKLDEYCKEMGHTLTLSQAQVPGTIMYEIMNNGNKNLMCHDFLVETDGWFKE